MGQFGSSNFNEGKIFSWLKRVYDTYMSNNTEVVGVFLRGSNNYGLDYPSSDIDCLCVIVPGLDSLINEEKPISTSIKIDDSENQIEVKDIRLVGECYLKQHANFLETLFTDYYIINPTYIDLWAKLWEEREDIATYFPWRGLKAMQKNCVDNYKQIFKYSEDMAAYDEVKQYGYSSKNLYHLARIVSIMEAYVATSKLYWNTNVGIDEAMFGNSYKQVLTVFPKDVANYKGQGFFANTDEVNGVADELLERADNIVKEYEKAIPNYQEQKNEKTYNLVKNVAHDIIYRKIKKDMQKDM